MDDRQDRPNATHGKDKLAGRPGGGGARILAVLGGVAVLAAVLLAVRVDVAPPDTTRLIVDRTERVYIAPPCFEQANPTNNITETTLAGLDDFAGYRPESACTADALRSRREPLLVAIPAWLGLTRSGARW